MTKVYSSLWQLQCDGISLIKCLFRFLLVCQDLCSSMNINLGAKTCWNEPFRIYVGLCQLALGTSVDVTALWIVSLGDVLANDL